MSDALSTPSLGPNLDARLDLVLAIVDERGTQIVVPHQAREEARSAAMALFEACGGSLEALQTVLLGYGADLVFAVAVDLAADRLRTQRVLERLESEAGIPRAALGRQVLGTGRLLELPVDVGIEVHLALLLAFSGAETISLWSAPPRGDLARLASVGDLDGRSAALRAAARATLESGTERQDPPRSTLTVRVEPLRPPAAALVADRLDVGSPVVSSLLAAAVPSLAALLSRRALLDREQSQDSMAATVERRLARLRYDLHDGPQQDVHLLAQDLRLFRDQLHPMIADDPNRDRVLGRLDDLEAQLVALDGDLRRLSTAVQSPFLAPGSLTEALAQLTESFAARTGIVPAAEIAGLPIKLTDSQQITVLSLIREALSNIRKHSDASHVTIRIAADDGGLAVKIVDDGQGFDPEATLVRAARAGRLGLVGMHERVRMLGGRTQIASQPGGPTVISATLPPWPTASEV